MHDPITSLVVTVFSAPSAALIMAGAILALAVGLIFQSGHFEFAPLKDDLRRRADLLSDLPGTDRQKAFAEAFPAIDKRLSGTAHPTLELGWAAYRGQLAQTGDERLASSIHAVDAFEHADGPARTLEWWANLLVAIGLVITFMGIVAALTEAVDAMQRQGGAGMQTALMGLLAVAATKFWTSIAGVLGSIVLRLVARRRRKAIESLEAHFFALLDGCVRFAPPEKVMLEQLAVLSRIEAALAGSARVQPAAPSLA
ncbi:hypothetical protein [Caulobacter endophyticus]|uniref:MotA/TolQ/ExbB proton channel family protein n=1 Tax=Caulobacter endophyticus TaxID=2172652 RepID=A0A2T9JZF4_9CAUL|nr:hypothetical protein [Caulobacter endophyticus]PVM89106.1 hypothetical protein DDF67_12235 [Caulobacter endophyticus]